MTKRVLITGAGSGFGKGVALGLARKGHDVIAACEIWPQVTELRQLAREEGLELRVIKLDVRSQIDRDHAFQFEIDVLFNNAGIMESGPVLELPPQIVRDIFETNVFAALEMAQGFGKQMAQRGSGKIVWTSSIAGLVKVPWDSAYAASKHAVEAFCSAMREELAPYGVKVATVNPGAFRTGFNDTGMESQDQWWGQAPRVMDHWPVRELNKQHDPQEMIDAIIDVIEADEHPYRTVRPAAAEEMAKREQREEWERKV
ncbi:SDR family oxidoreductase [Paracoccus fistulariae]|uniref:SDR family oxidoreductase n=1 Tax=Paracoccus fistulariae TaxID=658446 RepID=A0ABY7SJT2_9RHOB|nr:SDR family oxidoreductase [Paracoccus fistulariae]MDB6180710.1 SDR family oxidoreductase [Paracoccus fistulariae]WCR07061.1 SDR family oxidoreductase [Paracoccus fistulariae]